ncbi:MAG: hypothetical protein JXA77_01315 [Bacteroidales bacterium]|nr:hypothetical protein [Bacteroidales bacterium]MBN2821041.1 hypothetical protein [Bacteroidales bacterium]
MKKLVYILPLLLLAALLVNNMSCSTSRIPKEFPTDTLFTNSDAEGWPLELIFIRGKSHNHPLMAAWVTDTNGKYIETLYVAKSIAKGEFEHGDKSTGKWMPGPIRRPAALPVWAHQRNVIETDGLYIPTTETALPDAITGATPQNNFVLLTKTTTKALKEFDVYFEINQTWDWNEYWTNNKYPNDKEYKTSCQPALVYKARINADEKESKNLELIGHSHYNGSSGEIFVDLSTITTAKNISESIKIQFTGADK